MSSNFQFCPLTLFWIIWEDVIPEYQGSVLKFDIGNEVSHPRTRQLIHSALWAAVLGRGGGRMAHPQRHRLAQSLCLWLQ